MSKYREFKEFVGLATKRPRDPQPPTRPTKPLPRESDDVKLERFGAKLPGFHERLKRLPEFDQKAGNFIFYLQKAVEDKNLPDAERNHGLLVDRIDELELPMHTALEALKFDATTSEQWATKKKRCEAFLEKYEGYPQQCAEARKILDAAPLGQYATDSKATEGGSALNPMEPGKIFGKLAEVMQSKLVQQCGLSEPEVIAIRTYTAENYKFINPATANSKDRPDDKMLDLNKAKNAEEKQQMEADIAKFKNKGWLDDKGQLNFENVGKAIRARAKPISKDELLQLKQQGATPMEIARRRLSEEDRKLLEQEEAEFAAAVKKYKKPEFMDIQMEKSLGKRKISKLTDEDARQQEQKQFDEDYEARKKDFYEKGSSHAAVLMKALKKLPKQKGNVFRGARMSEAEFNSSYAKGKEFTIQSFQSNSTTESVAEGFATGVSSMSPLKDDQTLHVMCVIEVFDAKDVNELSVTDEKEWLLLPETKLVVTDIKTKTSGGPKGNFPFAKKWITVQMKQKI